MRAEREPLTSRSLRRSAEMRSRAVMRAERERGHLPRVALAGYTNAG